MEQAIPEKISPPCFLLILNHHFAGIIYQRNVCMTDEDRLFFERGAYADAVLFMVSLSTLPARAIVSLSR
jgi:hypothetical protein